MTQAERERLDFWQNLAIAILTVSAVLLCSRTELFRQGLGSARDYFRIPAEPGTAVPLLSDPAVSAPMRLAVTNRFGGRYAAVTLSTSDAVLVRRLMGDALGAGAALEAISPETFFHALDAPSVYCDFLFPLPLSVLAGMMNAASPETTAARYAVLAEMDNGEPANHTEEGKPAEETEKTVGLFLWDGQYGCYRSIVPVSVRELEETILRYELGGAFFAMDRIETDAGCRFVLPLSLFLDETPTLPVLTAVSGFPDTDRVLTALRFNPMTHYRYPEPNGTEVVVESGRSLRIRSNGSVYYQSGGQGDVSLEGMGETPTLWEAVSGSFRLLETMLPEEGEGSFCLREIRQEDTRTELRFGYQIRGLPVCFVDGGAAAAITLEGRNVSFLEARARRYAVSDTDSLLLPLPQALGVAAMTPGRELFLGYEDTGDVSVKARWLFGGEREV